MSLRFQNVQLYMGLFVISAATLLLELTLTRIFDVILWANLAYLIVSGAIFGFGLAGIVLVLWPMPGVTTDKLLAASATAFCATVLLLIPAIKWLPANLKEVPDHLLIQSFAFGSLYLFLLLPFFASGLVVVTIVTRYARHIHYLYFWDLIGAGLGCLGIFVFPSLIGGEETLLVVAAAAALSVALLARRGSWTRRGGGWAMVGLALLTILFSNRIDFPSLVGRGIYLSETGSRVEFSRWDPISKIEVLRLDKSWGKHIAYDGGSQGSMFRSFDGDLPALRRNYFKTVDGENRYNSGKYVALAHWLKRDAAPQVLVIGSAGGQETLAGLAWGAAHLDAVEMVCTVVQAALGPYADFIGRIFTNPRVTVTCDEGRSFLRQSDRRYDIIQIHSNHTTSSVANGSGGAMPVYLQTVEAYKEYLSHLTDEGILQINYFVYPRMITTAAYAWHELFPGKDFRRHLVIVSGYPTMDTFLVKRSEWTRDEIQAIRHFLSPEFADPRTYKIIYAPGEPEARSVPDQFFQVPLQAKFEETLPYKVSPPTDDRPFFRDLRKQVRQLQADEKGYVPPATVEFLNLSLRKFVLMENLYFPMENLHLYVLGGLSVVISIIFVFVPLLWFRRRSLYGAETVPALVYFACLGAGFIIVELVFISKCVLLIGSPIYSMATVLFTLLASAGIGSFLSARLASKWGRRAILAIPAFGLIAVLLIFVFPFLGNLTLGMSQVSRILLVSTFLVPLGIPLGMPFPLGIAALESKAPHLIPWAWGVNGFMTVVGSLVAVICSTKFGFNATLILALAIYLIAMVSFAGLKKSSPDYRGPDTGR
ncbi:MAG: hypothetical protein HY067_16760 [Betaproteobacteria bacterium]|nr:hypothetical protein [Betaproteobacteria bacterium]